MAEENNSNLAIRAVYVQGEEAPLPFEVNAKNVIYTYESLNFTLEDLLNDYVKFRQSFNTIYKTTENNSVKAYDKRIILQAIEVETETQAEQE